jgi:hypothetical protein
MKMMLILAGFLAGPTSCAGWTEAHRSNRMDDFRVHALPGAAHAMNCEESQVEIRLIPDGASHPNRALLSGCDSRSTYVLVAGEWVMESGPGR